MSGYPSNIVSDLTKATTSGITSLIAIANENQVERYEDAIVKVSSSVLRFLRWSNKSPTLDFDAATRADLKQASSNLARALGDLVTIMKGALLRNDTDESFDAFMSDVVDKCKNLLMCVRKMAQILMPFGNEIRKMESCTQVDISALLPQSSNKTSNDNNGSFVVSREHSKETGVSYSENDTDDRTTIDSDNSNTSLNSPKSKSPSFVRKLSPQMMKRAARFPKLNRTSSSPELTRRNAFREKRTENAHLVIPNLPQERSTSNNCEPFVSPGLNSLGSCGSLNSLNTVEMDESEPELSSMSRYNSEENLLDNHGKVKYSERIPPILSEMSRVSGLLRKSRIEVGSSKVLFSLLRLRDAVMVAELEGKNAELDEDMAVLANIVTGIDGEKVDSNTYRALVEGAEKISGELAEIELNVSATKSLSRIKQMNAVLDSAHDLEVTIATLVSNGENDNCKILLEFSERKQLEDMCLQDIFPFLKRAVVDSLSGAKMDDRSCFSNCSARIISAGGKIFEYIDLAVQEENSVNSDIFLVLINSANDLLAQLQGLPSITALAMGGLCTSSTLQEYSALTESIKSVADRILDILQTSVVGVINPRRSMRSVQSSLSVPEDKVESMLELLLMRSDYDDNSSSLQFAFELDKVYVDAVTDINRLLRFVASQKMIFKDTLEVHLKPVVSDVKLLLNAMKQHRNRTKESPIHQESSHEFKNLTNGVVNIISNIVSASKDERHVDFNSWKQEGIWRVRKLLTLTDSILAHSSNHHEKSATVKLLKKRASDVDKALDKLISLESRIGATKVVDTAIAITSTIKKLLVNLEPLLESLIREQGGAAESISYEDIEKALRVFSIAAGDAMKFSSRKDCNDLFKKAIEGLGDSLRRLVFKTLLKIIALAQITVSDENVAYVEKKVAELTRLSRAASVTSNRRVSPFFDISKTSGYERGMSFKIHCETFRRQSSEAVVKVNSEDKAMVSNGDITSLLNKVSGIDPSIDFQSMLDANDVILMPTENHNDPYPPIRAATLPMLVERLTSHEHMNPDFMKAFLLTYRSFTTPKDLFRLIIARFNVKPESSLSASELATFNTRFLLPIRVRSFNLLHHWVDNFFVDFLSDCLLDQLKGFLDVFDSPLFPTNHAVYSTGLANSIKRLIRKKLANNNSGKTYTPESIIKGRQALNYKHITDMRPGDVARQLTLIEFDMYRRINATECLDQCWSKADKKHQAPNIIAMIVWFNNVSAHVTVDILSHKSAKNRAATIKFYISIMTKLRSLNNFNCLTAVLAGVTSSAVLRLKRTWGLISQRWENLMSTMQTCMDASHNYSSYRRILHTSKPPVIPFLGMYLTDLTFIAEGNPETIKNSKAVDLINFDRHRRVAEVIREMKQYQLTSYNLDIEINILNYFDAPVNHCIEEFYARSLELEPRNATQLPDAGKSSMRYDSIGKFNAVFKLINRSLS